VQILKTGKQLWEERLPNRTKGESWSSTLLVGDRIYAVTSPATSWCSRPGDV